MSFLQSLKSSFTKQIVFLLVLSCFFTSLLSAAESKKTAAESKNVNSKTKQSLEMKSSKKEAVTDGSERGVEDAQQQIFIDNLITKYQLDGSNIKKWLNEARKKQSIIDAMNRPAEGVLSWKKYRKIFMTKKRLDQGIKFWQKYEPDLVRAEKEYGVPAEMIVSIIGIETFYGRIKGNYRVLDALYTLAFHYPKRGKFFRSELGHFFRLTQQQQWQPDSKIGSYAGAMGYGQFMPSSYLSYGVDFDHDGKIDLIDNPVDAIGSVANYFKKHGWVTGGKVVTRAHLINWQASKKAGRSTRLNYKYKDLQQSGVVTKDKLSDDTKVSLMIFDQETQKEYWVGLKNFYVISRYNRSHMYSLVAFQLSQKLKKKFNQLKKHKKNPKK